MALKASKVFGRTNFVPENIWWEFLVLKFVYQNLSIFRAKSLWYKFVIDQG
jgi:hypothetical protein